MVVGKWMLRMIGRKYGVTVSFAPKIMVGHAGSGLHIHTKLTRDGKSVMVENGRLSDTAKKAIAGYLTLAPSLTAFGNTNPVSYLRLVPHQEAPTNICWGDREPLGARARPARMAERERHGQALQPAGRQPIRRSCRQSDGRVPLFRRLGEPLPAARGAYGRGAARARDAGCPRRGEEALCGRQHLPRRAQGDSGKAAQLPASCWDSAENLLRDRAIYEKDGVFSPMTIDGVAGMLKAFDDRDLSEKLYRKDDKIRHLVDQFLHC